MGMQSGSIEGFANWLKALEGSLADPTAAGPASCLFCVVSEFRKRRYSVSKKLGNVFPIISHLMVLPYTQAAMGETSLPPHTPMQTLFGPFLPLRFF